MATLLELTGLLWATARRCSLRFVAFVGEEPPFFFTGQQGSLVYARAARRRGDRIRLMLSLEMLGYYHAASDTPETLDYPRLAAVTAGLAGALNRLAGERPGFGL